MSKTFYMNNTFYNTISVYKAFLSIRTLQFEVSKTSDIVKNGLLRSLHGDLSYHVLWHVGDNCCVFLCSLEELRAAIRTNLPVEQRIEVARRQQAARAAARLDREQARIAREMERSERQEAARRDREARSQQLLEVSQLSEKY